MKRDQQYLNVALEKMKKAIGEQGLRPYQHTIEVIEPKDERKKVLAIFIQDINICSRVELYRECINFKIELATGAICLNKEHAYDEQTFEKKLDEFFTIIAASIKFQEQCLRFEGKLATLD